LNQPVLKLTKYLITSGLNEVLPEVLSNLTTVISATSASAARSFSALRRMTTYLYGSHWQHSLGW